MKPQSPKPEELKQLRERHNLTQSRAARLVFSSLRAWQYYESGDHLMHPIIWAYAKYAARRRDEKLEEARARIASTPGQESVFEDATSA
jgi:transcriptional regulator with XRE-family HTH domain